MEDPLIGASDGSDCSREFAMGQSGKLRADFGQIGEINFRRYDPGHIRSPRKNPSPGINYHRISIRREALGIVADLVGGDHVNLILDGSRTQKKLPMGFAG